MYINVKPKDCSHKPRTTHQYHKVKKKNEGIRRKEGKKDKNECVCGEIEPEVDESVEPRIVLFSYVCVPLELLLVPRGRHGNLPDDKRIMYLSCVGLGPR